MTKKIAAVYIIAVSQDLCMMAYCRIECRYIVHCRVLIIICKCHLDKLCLIGYHPCILRIENGIIQLQLIHGNLYQLIVKMAE